MRTTATILLCVVGKIKSGAFENQTRTTGDFPLCRRATNRADLNWWSHNALKFFKLVAVLADVLVCGHFLIQVLLFNVGYCRRNALASFANDFIRRGK